MKRFYKWCLRKYLSLTHVRKGEVVVIAIKDEVRKEELEALKTALDEYIPKTVIIAGVDKIIVT